MNVNKSRHIVCADNLSKIAQGLEDIEKQLNEANVSKKVIDQLKGQIEFLKMQDQEVRDMWESILKAMNNDVPDEDKGPAVISSRPNVQ